MTNNAAIKEIIKKSFVYNLLVRYKKAKATRTAIKAILAEWDKDGRPAPPPHIYKINTIKEYAVKFRIKVFIETGTFHGDTLKATMPLFKKSVSIELDKKLYQSGFTKPKAQ